MWLATKSGFFSVVVDTTKPGWMLVRARAKADLENLYRDYSESCPSMTSLTAREDRDYRWRMGTRIDQVLQLFSYLQSGLIATTENQSEYGQEH
jgi:hypothetical protein